MKFTSRIDAKSFYRRILKKAESVKNVPATMAELGRRDLFFLLLHILNRADIDRDWLFDRCAEVQQSPDGHLDLWAREHYKSTIITYGLSIQNILKNPDVTIGIFSHTRPIAKSFLRQIKRELEDNNLLKQLYPDIFYENPRKESPKWSEDDGLIVRRKSNPKEATVEAHGLVDGQPTSRHFSILVYDDVVTRESVTTPEMIKKTTDAWALSLNLASAGGTKRYIGTRYHYNDTYKAILDRNAAIPRLYPATDTGQPDGEPVLISAELLAEKRREMGPYIFGCQMLQDPKADEIQGFRTEWLRYWMPKSDGLNLYLLVDPASAKKRDSDYTVMSVIGLGADRNFYVVDFIRDRLSLTERADALFRLHRKYRPVKVGYEKYGMQADIEHCEDRMERENYRFQITELKGNIPKIDRIKKLIPLFEQGRLYLPETLTMRDYEGKPVDLIKEFKDSEYTAFPVSAHDDMLDCFARIVDPELGTVWPALNSGSFQPKRRKYAA